MSNITPSELELILEVLPEPLEALVSLCNYNDQIFKVLREAEKTISEIGLENIGISIVAELKYPTKQKILNIYKSSYNIDNMAHPDFVKPRIELHRINWDIRKKEDNNLFESNITLTPSRGINIDYWGAEPQYIAQLRQILVNTHIPIITTINDYSNF